MIESELFGHKRGAFTGATTDRDGAFAQANGGAIFLDEIGELPKDLQSKLLRVLEARTVRPVGSTQPVSIDVRVIAATHRDLFAMASAGEFRLDLFHRLAVIHAVIPPLRDRRDELPTLIQALHESRGAEPAPIIGPNLDRLERHHWPGNVRELRNVLERAWVLSAHPNPSFEQLDIWLDASTTRRATTVDVNLPLKAGKERGLVSPKTQVKATDVTVKTLNSSSTARLVRCILCRPCCEHCYLRLLYRPSSHLPLSWRAPPIGESPRVSQPMGRWRFQRTRSCSSRP